MPSAEPKAVRVNKTTGTGMEIDWKDSHQSVYTFKYLRDACPCATCNEEREKTGAKRGEAPNPKPAAFQMYKDPARPTEVNPVGRYAISFGWNDGHTSGIYSWEFLRSVCPCAECKAIRDNGGELKTATGGSVLD